MNTRIAGNTGELQDVKKFGEKNTTLRALTEAITIEPGLFSSSHGDSYNVNSGDITLTSGSESAVMYFKNTGAIDIIVQNIIYNIGNSTGGVSPENIKMQIVKNPTTGTIISTATAADIIENRNFGEANNLEANVYKGVEAATFTDGDDFLPSVAGSGGIRLSVPVNNILIPQGKSIGITITPQGSNTTMIVNVAMDVYKSDIPV